MEFFKSEKGKRKLALDGYMYCCDKTKNGVTYWRCEFYLKCKCRMATAEDGSIVRNPSDHSHAPDRARVEVAKAQSMLRDRAMTSDERPSNIVLSVTQNLSFETIGQLPKMSSLQRMIQRRRQLPGGAWLLAELRKTKGAEDFVLEDDGESGFYLFASQKNLDLLNNCGHWYCVGTFNVERTSMPTQLYIVHAMVNGFHTVPLVYTIMKQKSAATYRRLFHILQEQRPGIAPEYLTIDFDMAAHSALSELFPRAQIHGCPFQFGRCNFRKIQSLSLDQWYSEDPAHALLIKCFQALAFVPLEDVEQRYEEFMGTLREEEEQHLLEYIHYFEATWIGLVHGRTQKVHRQPIYPIQFWNTYHRVKNDLPYANGSIEDWHNAFSERISMSRPSLQRLVKKIIQEQNSNEILINKLNEGIDHLPRKKKCYNAVNRRIKTVVEGYHPTTVDIASYLRSIAQNL